MITNANAVVREEDIALGAVTVAASVEVSHKLEIDLTQEQPIAFLGRYPKDSMSYNRDICSSMFIIAFFTIARKRVSLDIYH